MQKELELFVEQLRASGVVAAPAEGVYGYCANPFDPVALERLVALKGRAPNKGFVLLIGSVEQLSLIAAPLNTAEKGLLEEHWPGQVTFILPAKAGLPKLLTGGRSTVAVRLPAVGYMQDYLKAWGGPLVSTSANRSGEPPAITLTGLEKGVFALKSPVPLKGGVSKIIDLKTGQTLR